MREHSGRGRLRRPCFVRGAAPASSRVSPFARAFAQEQVTMPFTVDKLPDFPAVLFVQRGGRAAAESGAALGRLISELIVQPEPVFLVLDMCMPEINPGAPVDTAREAALRPGKLRRHPDVREIVVVSADALAELAARGLRSANLGGMTLRVFATTGQALAYCREQLFAEASGGAHRVISPARLTQARSRPGGKRGRLVHL